MTHIVPIDICFYLHNVAKDKRYFVQSSYYIPVKMTEYLLIIAVLRQNMRAVMFYTIHGTAKTIVPEQAIELYYFWSLCIILVSFYIFYTCTVRFKHFFLTFQSERESGRMLKNPG